MLPARIDQASEASSSLGSGAEDRARQPFAGAGPERAEADRVEALIAEQLREDLADVGARRGDHEDRPIDELEGALDELQAREIAPVEVLEHDDERQGGAGGTPPRPTRWPRRAAQLLGAQRRA